MLGVLGLAVALPFAGGHAAEGFVQDGVATYYGNHWVGHRTSSGAVFDQEKLTAAHSSLPLGTRLLVVSETTGDSVVVTVNDREPDHGDRIIDLSRAAARRLHMIGAGTADVEISRASAADIAENEDEVAEAPDDGADQDVAMPPTRSRVSHAPRGPRHRLHVRR
jgi:rare lipoprotein A